MRKRVNNINSLRMAKIELKSDIKLKEAKVEMAFDRIKEHYVPLSGESSGGSNWLAILPSMVLPIAGNFIVHKLLKSKGKLSATLGRLILTFLKK